MSNYNIFITEPAQNDLYKIGTYILKELLEPETAKRTVSKIADSIKSLEKMPNRNTLVRDERLANKRIRKTIMDNYIIFYIVDDNRKTVTIIRILYARRDWINFL